MKRKEEKNERDTMRKNIIHLLVAAAVIATCDGKKSQLPADEVAEKTVAETADSDSTVYGACGDGSAMNTLQLITEQGDTLVLSTTDANDRGRCIGGFQSGDRMAVILKDGLTASQVINLSALSGNWISAGQPQTGISLKEDGVAEGIGNTSVEYRSWRLLNGRLVIESVKGGEAITGVYDIVSIGPDSLVFRDSEQLFEYSRK